jgi:hypothetical protein
VEARIPGRGAMIVETETDVKKAYEASVNISWAMIAALVLCPIVVEIVSMSLRPFAGLSPESAHRIKDFVYGLAILLPLCIKSIRKAIFRRRKSSDLKTLAYKLRTATAMTMIAAEMPALLGLSLFLLGGFYREFYIALVYSLLVMIVYFPRRQVWENLFRRGVFY